MRMYVAMTDYHWFQFLKSRQPEEVNFWQPRDQRNFNAIKPGELFLFKLRAPRHYIVGGGVFLRQVFLPLSLMWDAFGPDNGRASLAELLEDII